MNELYKAIMAKYNADSDLSGALTGGLSKLRAPQRRSCPYAVFFPVTGHQNDTFNEHIENVLIQFNIFDDAKDEDSSTIDTIRGYLWSCFDDCHLVVDHYHDIFMQRRNTYTLDIGDSFQIIVEYEVELQKRKVTDYDAQYSAEAADNTVHDISTQDISLSLWLKASTAGAGTNNWLVTKYMGSGIDGYAGYIYTDGTLQFYVRESTSKIFVLQGTTDIRNGSWRHVAFVIDRSDVDNCKIFIDGEDDTSGWDGTTIESIGSISNDTVFRFSTASDGMSQLDGRICDVKLYYAAGSHWSDAQVAYQAAHPFDYSNSAGTITEYWKCTEGGGVNLNGSADNDLTLSSSNAWVEDSPG